MLTCKSRVGFTLLETVVATAMSLVVCAALYQLLLTTQRLARMQSEHLTLQATVRNAVLVVLNELRELAISSPAQPGENDVLAASGTALVYRASRGFGLLCQPSTPTQLRLSQGGFTGARDPQPGRDTALVFIEGDTSTDVDDFWLPLGIMGVSTTASCAGPEPGITLTVAPAASLASVPAGTPVRVVEPMELKLYRSEGKAWLGLRSIASGEAVQPLAGPLADDGLSLVYRDQEGRQTSDLFALRSIGLELIAMAEVPPGGGDHERSPSMEQLAAGIALRNVPR
jgi:type II secretory pathway pseudopilin PulG